jgi:hypothetical protein
MMTYKLAIIAILASAFSACKKISIEDPIAQSAPVFKVHGTLGETTIDLAAGENNGIMQTKDSLINGVTCFKGNLSDKTHEFELNILDGDLDLQTISFIEKLPDDLPFAGGSNQPLMFLSKDIFSNKQVIQEIKWYINGEMAGVDNAIISTSGHYLIDAHVTFTNGSSATLSNDLIVGYKNHHTSSIHHVLYEGGHLKAWVDEETSDFQSIKWYVDGEYESSQFECNPTLSNDFHVITAEFVFKNGAKRLKSILVHGSNPQTFLEDFSIYENTSYKQKSDYTTQLRLKKDGKTYSTYNAPNATSTFHVLGVTYYGKNNSGKEVYTLNAELDCIFKNVNSSETIPFSGTILLGIEIP